MNTKNIFVVVLEFSENKSLATQYMEGHMEWLEKGFSSNIFFLSGSIMPNRGGSILARNITLAELQGIVDADPFVRENIVTAEILEIVPTKIHEDLSF
ncbi:hypothetical protein LVD17_14575 [Fulvivirga ulvae]|uniref:YciI family protein n=1 Tax=Fulvivirga ulvae TaxID=2904245 RepID=UPI001F4527DF|nr:hypothetical protein [Fulvivirga ulvae]UII35032.1 hypothetical protein LVD17_14575 [Fulvivirga ulvae]